MFSLKKRFVGAVSRLLRSHPGYCPICERKVRFIAYSTWLRDNYRCSRCKSIPRLRAIVDTLKRFYPNWADLVLHESSPNNMAASRLLKSKCKAYSSSQYYDDVPRGKIKDGHQSEDLSALTFKDESFDLLITQDVFEHVMEPERAFREIGRVLKPGGAHIFSMPWYPELRTSRRRAVLVDGHVKHLLEPIYHGNPVDRKKGSLVTTDWGQDLVDIIYRASGLSTMIYLQRDRNKGLDGEFLEIFVSRKPYLPDSIGTD